MEKRYGFDRRFISFLLHIVVPFLKSAFGVKNPERMKLPEGPCIVLFNHVTDLDVVWIMDFFWEQIYCVASEHVVRFPVAGKVLMVFFAPILIKKGTNGASAVLEMSRHLRLGHKVMMAPEGVRTGNGVTNPIIASTASVLKKLKCPVVTVRIHGGYFTTPRWGKGIRKGRITMEKIGEYSVNEIAAMSSEEFFECITKDLAEDAYAYNVNLRTAFRGKNPAEGIETQLYLCPGCTRFFTIRSKGKEFFCDCGLHGTIDEYGKLSGKNVPYSAIRDWDAWESAYLESMSVKKTDDFGNSEPVRDVSLGCGDKILLQSPDMTLCEISQKHKNIPVDSGELKLTAGALSVGNTEILLSEITDVSIIAYGILLFFTKDKHYYEIRGKKPYPGEAYLKLIRKLKS